jgi:hypothetical protein
MGIGKKIKRTVLLPKRIVEEVNRFDISPTQRSYAFKFIWLLMRDSQRKHDNIYSPVERTYQDLEANYTKHYYKWIKLLLRSKLVKRISYSKNNCFKYYLNADKLYNITSGLLCSPNLEEDLIEVTIFDKIYPQDQYQIWFNQDINSLNMDKKKLEPLFKHRVENVTVETSKIKVVEELLAGRYKLYSPYGKPGSRRFFSHDEINIRSKLTNTSIIVSKKGVILDDVSRFLERRRESIVLYDKNALNQLFSQDYKATRNTTNNRLDTNLTNLPSVYTDWICKRNNLIQIDLANSQLCFLSMMLEDTPGLNGVDNFCSLSFSGEIYTYVQNQLGLETRDDAKLLLITILFSSNYNSKGKKEFKSLFPEVHEWLHAYKKEHGYKNISITLQKMESKLFIDKIYVTLKKRGVFCLTKHDSLIIRHNDLGKIMRTLESVCEKSSFSGTFKINYPNKDEVEKIVFNFK